MLKSYSHLFKNNYCATKILITKEIHFNFFVSVFVYFCNCVLFSVDPFFSVNEAHNSKITHI